MIQNLINGKKLQWVILLFALVALGLSIAAIAKPCSSNFGDIGPDGKPGKVSLNEPCEVPSEYSVACEPGGYGLCAKNLTCTIISPDVKNCMPGKEKQCNSSSQNKTPKPTNCDQIKVYCNSLDYNSCFDNKECSFDGQECTFSPDTNPECIDKGAKKTLGSNGHGEYHGLPLSPISGNTPSPSPSPSPSPGEGKKSNNLPLILGLFSGGLLIVFAIAFLLMKISK